MRSGTALGKRSRLNETKYPATGNVLQIVLAVKKQTNEYKNYWPGHPFSDGNPVCYVNGYNAQPVIKSLKISFYNSPHNGLQKDLLQKDLCKKTVDKLLVHTLLNLHQQLIIV